MKKNQFGTAAREWIQLRILSEGSSRCDHSATTAPETYLNEKMNGNIPKTVLQLIWHRALLHPWYCCCILLMLSGLVRPASVAAIDRKTSTANGQKDAGQARADHDGLDEFPSSLFWQETDECKVKAHFTEEDRRTLAKKMRSLSVVSLKPGCGRMKNRLATLEDGTRVCCRYRDNRNQIRGDVYAYHLSGLLSMWNVPSTAAVKLDLFSPQWCNVRETAIEAGWQNGATIAVSQFVDDLEEEFFPSLLKNASSPSLTASSAAHASTAEMKRLMEWTDMIVFDFLIGHTDRLFNALLNSQWNSHMMEKPVHNLKRTASSSDLVLLDNESGFDFGYIAAKQKDEYYRLQMTFLERICVFRAPTIRALIKLGSTDGEQSTPPSANLEKYIRQVDQRSYSALRKWRTQSQTEFDTRVKETLKRVRECSS